MSDKERKLIIEEIQQPDFTLCPNITEFKVQGELLFGKSYLSLKVTRTELAATSANFAVVYLTEISRVFEPEFYQKHSFERPVTTKTSSVRFMPNRNIMLSRQIAKSSVTLHSFKWLDTSAFTIFDFS